jgi:hypothetical protein
MNWNSWKYITWNERISSIPISVNPDNEIWVNQMQMLNLANNWRWKFKLNFLNFKNNMLQTIFLELEQETLTTLSSISFSIKSIIDSFFNKFKEKWNLHFPNKSNLFSRFEFLKYESFSKNKQKLLKHKT